MELGRQETIPPDRYGRGTLNLLARSIGTRMLAPVYDNWLPGIVGPGHWSPGDDPCGSRLVASVRPNALHRKQRQAHVAHLGEHAHAEQPGRRPARQ